ncbi:MAG: hemerythrin domain-containing protein [Spirochaetes bacterium]|nr:hemerythrin domain-containing protein [Spirochaetota bacterium]
MSCGHFENLEAVDLDIISAVSILSGEHRVILQVIQALVAMADRAEKENAIPLDHASQALEVLRNFADKCHHGKEENILFPALDAAVPGFGPTQVMRADHVEGRAFIQGVAAAVDGGDVAKFVQNAHGYAGLLRSHIEKEDGILFPMAMQILRAEQHGEILDAYRAIEHDDMGDGTHERMLGLADSLASAYGVERASEDPRIMALLTAVCGCKA